MSGARDKTEKAERERAMYLPLVVRIPILYSKRENGRMDDDLKTRSRDKRIESTRKKERKKEKASEKKKKNRRS